jgi:predicted AlkP superfamily pyrophosphatase or phosphodiesterase
MVSSAPVRRIRPLLALLAGLALAAHAAAESRVILISLDGATPAQIADPALATLARMRREGAAAERMTPVFPTNTFPNHVSLVTGVSPDRHGIVNNVFLDPARGRYSYENDPSWIEVEPIWSLAARHGLVSAAFHWVGSEGEWRSGLGPRHWKRFDARVPESEKVDQILAWLALPDAAERPRLVTAWFRGSDGSAHRRGPDSDAVRDALRAQDAELGRLLDGLAARGLLAETTLFVVSDHGVAPARRALRLERELHVAGVRARVFGGGGFASLALDDPAEAPRAVEAVRALGLEAWRREDAPPELRVGHPRFADVVVVAPAGTALATGDRLGSRVQRVLAWTGLAYGGVHGHRAEEPEMAAVFVAFGAGVAPGRALGAVRTLDVAPTLLAQLGIPVPEWMEGRPIELTGPLPADAGTVDSAR